MPCMDKKIRLCGDVKYICHLIDLENAVLPIYVCPDDLNFSCIVLVVEVEKTKDYVYWNRVGYVNQKEGNILWFADLNFVYSRNDYDAVVDEYRKRETLFQLENYRETDM